MEAGVKLCRDDAPVTALAESAARPAWKRNLDLALIIITAPLSVSVGLGLALLVKLTSRGPVLFRQERIGLHGRRFLMLKFRTMKVDADNSAHQQYLQSLIASSAAPMTKLDMKGDPRLIACGSVLRATGLDELPQLINVLQGHMSLVGPRPCLPYEFEKYSPEQRRRLDAFPGLTGFWQVNGKNHTSFDEMIRMDVWYSQHKSLGLDLKIIARTGPALLGQVFETVTAGRAPRSAPTRKTI